MHRALPLLVLPGLVACSSTGSTVVSSTSGSSSSSGAASSSSACINMGSCYGMVACPVGSVCFENTFICCAYSGGTGGSSSGTSTTTHGGSSSGGVDAGPPYAQGWPKWHCDNADQGRSQVDTSANNGTVIWKVDIGAPAAVNGVPTYMNSPVVDEAGTVYQLGMDGTFYAFGDGGSTLWTVPLLTPNPDAHSATPIIAADDTLYIDTGSDTGGSPQLFHLDATTGKILFQAGPPVGARIPAADGFDLPPSIGTDGYLFDGDDHGGAVTYSVNSDGSFTLLNVAVLEFSSERLGMALDEQNVSYWCSDFCASISTPETDFQAGWGLVPFGNTWSYANSDLAYDLSHTGWLMVEVGTWGDGGTAVGTTEVGALDRSNGATHWSTTLPWGPTPGLAGRFSADVGNSAPAIGVDGTVYVGNVNGLYAFDGGTGAIQAGFPYLPSQDTGANADVDSAAAIGGDGTIFFGTVGGTFYAVKPDGTERFHYTTGGRISSSPAIGPDGTVFFVSDDGYLYAIR